MNNLYLYLKVTLFICIIFTIFWHFTEHNYEGNKIRKNLKSNDYEESLTKIGSFKNKKDFWKLYQHLKKPKECESGIEYYLFKNNIKPIWEDELNIHGGKFTFLLNKDLSSLIWEEMIISFCGGIIPYFNDINGICIAVRKTYDVAQIWFNNFENINCIQMRNSIKNFFKKIITGLAKAYP